MEFNNQIKKNNNINVTNTQNIIPIKNTNNLIYFPYQHYSFSKKNYIFSIIFSFPSILLYSKYYLKL